jgi:hypothetical protein
LGLGAVPCKKLAGLEVVFAGATPVTGFAGFLRER